MVEAVEKVEKMDPDFDNSGSQNFVIEQYTDEEQKTKRSASVKDNYEDWALDSSRVLAKKKLKPRSKTQVGATNKAKNLKTSKSSKALSGKDKLKSSKIEDKPSQI